MASIPAFFTVYVTIKEGLFLLSSLSQTTFLQVIVLFRGRLLKSLKKCMILKLSYALLQTNSESLDQESLKELWFMHITQVLVSTMH